MHSHSSERRPDSVCPLKYHTNEKFWTVSGAKEAYQILQNGKIFDTRIYPQIEPDLGLAHDMLTSDGTRQKRLRHAFFEGFTSRLDFLTERVLIPSAAKCVPQLDPKVEIDLISSYIKPYFTDTVSGLIGIDTGDLKELCICIRHANDRFLQGTLATLEVRAAQQLLVERAVEIYTKASSMLAGHGFLRWNYEQSADRRLPIPDCLSITFSLIKTLALNIEHELTVDLHHQLAKLPPTIVWRLFRENAMLEQAAHEALRMQDGRFIPRVANADTEICGVKVCNNDTIMLSLGLIGRDPRAFKDPDHFNPWRQDLSNYPGFGVGEHSCVGEKLAKAIAATAARVLIGTSGMWSLVSASPGKLIVRGAPLR